MAHQTLIGAVAVMVAGLPIAAGIPGVTGAPVGTPATQFCLRVEPITGSRIETVQCRTREEWAQLDISVDQEWAENGVRVVG